MKDKYRIYNYLKNHEGALIALVSGVAGFVLMALNFVLYITDRFYLSEWNCSLIPVENSPSRFYSLCIWFAFFVVYFFWGKFLGRAPIEFENCFTMLNRYTLELKEQKKMLKLCERKLKRAKKEGNEENLFVFQEISDEMEYVKEKICSVNAEIVKTKNKIQFEVIAKIVIFSAKCSVPIVLIKYIQTLDFMRSLKLTLYTIGMPLVVLIPISLLLLNVFSRKESIGFGGVESFRNISLSDSMIVWNCKSAALTFVLVVGLILYSVVVENSSKKDFEIFNVDNQKYASIYESEHYLIGEKVSYSDSVITFFVNDQIVVEKNNLSIVKKKFEKVEKVDGLMVSDPE